MPLISNNEEFKFVFDQENYDRSEYVIAKKLEGKVRTYQTRYTNISISNFHRTWTMINFERLAHITFKSSQSTYFSICLIPVV